MLNLTQMLARVTIVLCVCVCVCVVVVVVVVFFFGGCVSRRYNVAIPQGHIQ